MKVTTKILIVVAVLIHYFLLVLIGGWIVMFNKDMVRIENERLERSSRYQKATIDYLKKQGFKIPD